MPRKNSIGKTQLQSNRYAVMYIDTDIKGWEFYDAFIQSRPVQMGMEAGDLSLPGKKLDKYLRRTGREYSKGFRKEEAKTVAHIPPHIVRLIQLQDPDGKFYRLPPVLHCLSLPRDLEFQKKYAEWEKATALAVCAFRQEKELFDDLYDYHDRAFEWVRTNEVLGEARELFSFFRNPTVQRQFGLTDFKFEDGDDVYSDDDEEQDPFLKWTNSAADTDDAVKAVRIDPNSLVPSNTATVEVLPTAAQTSGETDITSENAADNRDISAMGPGLALQDLTTGSPAGHNNSFITAGTDILADTSTIATNDFNFQNYLSQLSVVNTGNPNEDKIVMQKEIVAKVENKVLQLCLDLENMLKDVMKCMHRCIKAYNDCEIILDRYKTFDELTARLGDGFPATVAYDDWRKDGCPGIRFVYLELFYHVQIMAEERLYLLELIQYTGRDWTRKVIIEHNRSRWKLIWNGNDMVMKVIHSLDFLRRCRELSDWYGPAYYFVANPLMLPFAPILAYEGLNMKSYVEEQLEIVPHCRKGFISLVTNNPNTQRNASNQWQYDQMLNRWRREYFEMTNNWSFNWPNVANIREEDINEKMFIGMLVMFIAAHEHLETTHEWEQGFIVKILTVRGQDENLVGLGNQKASRLLTIPRAAERKPRAEFLKWQQHEEKMATEKRKKEEEERLAALQAAIMAPMRSSNPNTPMKRNQNLLTTRKQSILREKLSSIKENARALQSRQINESSFISIESSTTSENEEKSDPPSMKAQSSLLSSNRGISSSFQSEKLTSNNRKGSTIDVAQQRAVQAKSQAQQFHAKIQSMGGLLDRPKRGGKSRTTTRATKTGVAGQGLDAATSSSTMLSGSHPSEENIGPLQPLKRGTSVMMLNPNKRMSTLMSPNQRKASIAASASNTNNNVNTDNHRMSLASSAPAAMISSSMPNKLTTVNEQDGGMDGSRMSPSSSPMTPKGRDSRVPSPLLSSPSSPNLSSFVRRTKRAPSNALLFKSNVPAVNNKIVHDLNASISMATTNTDSSGAPSGGAAPENNRRVTSAGKKRLSTAVSFHDNPADTTAATTAINQKLSRSTTIRTPPSILKKQVSSLQQPPQASDMASVTSEDSSMANLDSPPKSSSGMRRKKSMKETAAAGNIAEKVSRLPPNISEHAMIKTKRRPAIQ